MSKVAVIYGSSRPSIIGKTVAEWFVREAGEHDGVDVSFIDLSAQDLPLFNEPMPPIVNQYSTEHSKKWSEKIAGYDGYVFVAAEYNKGITPILKNAVDYLFVEWAEKPIAYVTYGSSRKTQVYDQLHQIMASFKMKQVEETVHVAKVQESVTDDGVDSEHVQGDPKVVFSKLVELL